MEGKIYNIVSKVHLTILFISLDEALSAVEYLFCLYEQHLQRLRVDYSKKATTHFKYEFMHFKSDTK